MKAILPGKIVRNAKYPLRPYTRLASFHLVVVYKQKLLNPVTIRCYVSGVETHAVLRAESNKTPYMSGSGSVKGFGYHRVSSAVDKAITSAGIKLVHENTGEQQHINERGSIAVREAMKAITRTMGYRGETIIIPEHWTAQHYDDPGEPV